MHEKMIGPAHVRIEQLSDGQSRVSVRRSYVGGPASPAADQVWRIVADFGGLKVIFPSLVRVYISYPNAADGDVGTIRDMAFDPGPGGGKLNLGIEQLESVDHSSRTLAYISVLGMPVSGYRSVMTVSGDDVCELSWISTCRPIEGAGDFLEILAGILASGANQIATHLGID
ncbi:SRPBCC family protein [Mesorhizobium sp. M4B.F.Ca.ET.017.02.2.1]|uniref:SRPBCC family protein n=1 Tax=Mesorhizobium sp. M4B.F.Ca.ET.017.02.2.1 TaxID=2496649 RepID=UPI000FCA3088|nr:SRPBCC family protein [Mesorhizobium sp. M4B.F.Ca.ET.017.02.2.1]RVD31774.1 SRPBCC family protein [Mesorhizobium sp. M4B.F.Ca.ET.017.02.2.1]